MNFTVLVCSGFLLQGDGRKAPIQTTCTPKMFNETKERTIEPIGYRLPPPPSPPEKTPFQRIAEFGTKKLGLPRQVYGTLTSFNFSSRSVHILSIWLLTNCFQCCIFAIVTIGLVTYVDKLYKLDQKINPKPMINALNFGLTPANFLTSSLCL